MGDKVLLNQGTIYASLVRLQQRGWISVECGASANNRKAKFYSITKKGRKNLSADVAHWERLTSVKARVLAMQQEGGRPMTNEPVTRMCEFFNRLRSLFPSKQLDTELDAEMAAHLELAIEENLQRGMPSQRAAPRT